MLRVQLSLQKKTFATATTENKKKNEKRGKNVTVIEKKSNDTFDDPVSALCLRQFTFCFLFRLQYFSSFSTNRSTRTMQMAFVFGFILVFYPFYCFLLCFLCYLYRTLGTPCEYFFAFFILFILCFSPQSIDMHK